VLPHFETFTDIDLGLDGLSERLAFGGRAILRSRCHRLSLQLSHCPMRSR
jgi:hypothetical protein